MLSCEQWLKLDKTGGYTMINSLLTLHSRNVVDLTHDRLDAALSACGLSVNALELLQSLAEANNSRAIGELGGSQFAKTNVVQLVDSLKAEGLVQSVSNGANIDMARMAITEVGRQRCRLGQALSELAWDVG
jgi:hypothetical protein